MIFHNPQDLLNFNGKDVSWMMNINQEQKWNDVKYIPSVTDQQQLTLVLQQEQQLMFLAKPHEKVIFSHEPNEQFLRYLVKKGIALPKIMVNKGGILESDQVLDNTLLIPYIQSEETERLKEKSLNLEIFGGEFKLTKQLNNKYFVRRLLISNGINVTRGFFCSNIEDLKLAYSALSSEGFERCVIKVPYGSSGKGLYVVNNEKSYQYMLKYISRRTESFELLLEGWHDTKRSMNSQLYIHEDKVSLLAITEQLINEQGVYLGTNFLPTYRESIFEEYKYHIMRIGKMVGKMGYSGIIGIDSIIDTDNVIYPAIEINARFTQVTYLLTLVSTLKKRYKFIESSIIQCSSNKRFNFNQIKKKLECSLEPIAYDELFIYTYCVHEVGNKIIYKIFVLFLSNEKLIINRKKLDFNIV